MKNIRYLLLPLLIAAASSLSAQQLKQIQKGTDKNQIPVTNGNQHTQVYRDAIPYILDTLGLRDTINTLIPPSGSGSVTSIATTAPVTGGTITATGTIGLDINSTTLEVDGSDKLNAKNSSPIWNADKLQGKDVSSTAPTTGQVLKWNGSTWLPSTDATGSGTVTSVGLTAGTSGTDVNVSGSPITTSGTFTLNIPTASATNRGVISSTDWSIFNSKIGGSGTSTQVGYFSGTNTLTSSAGFTYASSILTTPYLRITNPSGTPTSIIGRNGSGDVGSITVGSGLSLSSGTLSATGITGSGTSGRVTFWNGSSSISSNANFLFDNTTGRMTIGKTGSGGGWINLQGQSGNGSQKAIEIQNSDGWVNAYIKSYNTTTSASRGLIFGSVNSAGTDVDALWVQGYNANGRVGVGGVPTNIFEVFTAGENSTGSKSGIQLTSPSYKMHQFLNHEGDALFQSTTGYFSFGSTSTFPGDMNPSAPLHLFTSLGAGEDIVFKLERAGGYGSTAFYQYYITGAGGRGMKINSDIGSEPAFITTKSDHSGNNRRIGIKEESPAQTLDVGGTMRLQSVTGTPTTIIGRNASGDIGTVSIGSGLSLSGGSLINTATPPNTWAEVSGNVINWNATGSFGSGKPIGIGTLSPARLLDLNGDAQLRGAIYSSTGSAGSTGQVLTSNGTGSWSWQNPSGSTQHLNFDTKSGADVYLNISGGGSGVNFRDGDNIELVRTASNVLTVRERQNWTLMALSSGTTSLSTSNTKITLLGGGSYNGDATDVDYDNTNNEIDVLVSGTYRIEYISNCKSNTAAHTVTFDILNSGSGSSLSGAALRANHYFDSTTNWCAAKAMWIVPISAGTSFYLAAKTSSGTPNINTCEHRLFVERLK